MAPTVIAIADMADIAVRYVNCPNHYYYRNGYCYYRSGWNRFGRWVLTGVIIVFFLLLLMLLACRRRRRRNTIPAQGSGWMGGRFGGHNQNQNQGVPQYGNNYATAPPPPEYSQQPSAGYQQPYKPEAQHTGTTYDSNQGYYGTANNGQGANDIQLQQPSQAYYPTRGGAADDYAPPEGPPPTKH